MGKMIMHNHVGDVTVAEWDVETGVGQDLAEELFGEHVLNKMAFTEESVQIQEFDPNAETILFLVPLQGG